MRDCISIFHIVSGYQLLYRRLDHRCRGLVFERLFPYFTKTDSGVEPIKDGEWHRYVSDDGPGPLAAVKLHLDGM